MAALETRGDVYTLIEVRAVEQACRLALGEQAAQAKVDWIVETARTIGTVDINVVVFAAAAAALVESAPDQARARLAELDEAEGSRATPYYARALPGTIRTALAAGRRSACEPTHRGLEPRHRLNEHALRAAQAQLTESAGGHAEAATLYADAAARWREFGNVPSSRMPCWDRGAACSRSVGRTPTSRFARLVNCSSRWVTNPRAPRRRCCSTRTTSGVRPPGLIPRPPRRRLRAPRARAGTDATSRAPGARQAG